MKRFALLALLLLTACGNKGAQPWLGYGEGEDAFVAAPMAGWVSKLGVTRGQEVKKGDLLFILDDTQQRAARDSAAANLANIKAQMNQNAAAVSYASKELTRQGKLVRAQAGTQSTLDLARSNFDQGIAKNSAIQAQEKQAEASLADAEY
jgi:HlyD family secretion protein